MADLVAFWYHKWSHSKFCAISSCMTDHCTVTKKKEFGLNVEVHKGPLSFEYEPIVEITSNTFVATKTKLFLNCSDKTDYGT